MARGAEPWTLLCCRGTQLLNTRTPDLSLSISGAEGFLEQFINTSAQGRWWRLFITISSSIFPREGVGRQRSRDVSAHFS